MLLNETYLRNREKLVNQLLRSIKTKAFLFAEYTRNQ